MDHTVCDDVLADDKLEAYAQSLEGEQAVTLGLYSQSYFSNIKKNIKKTKNGDSLCIV
jgi:hypothetical protein